MFAETISPPYRGPTLEVGSPEPGDEEHIVAVLQRPEVYRPLGMPRAPSAAEVATREWPLVGWHEGGNTAVVLLIARAHATAVRHSMWLHYGWDHAQDSTRELDTVALSSSASPGAYLEALVLTTIRLLTRDGARRLRWRVAGGGGGFTGTIFKRLSVRSLGEVDDRDPVSGTPIVKSVYELTRQELAQIAQRAGVTAALESDRFELSMATFLARLRAAEA